MCVRESVCVCVCDLLNERENSAILAWQNDDESVKMLKKKKQMMKRR